MTNFIFADVLFVFWKKTFSVFCNYKNAMLHVIISLLVLGGAGRGGGVGLDRSRRKPTTINHIYIICV